MKKIIYLTILALLTSSFSSHGQSQGEIRVGAGLALGTEAAINESGGSKLGVGINFGGEYLVTDEISIAPSYTIFFKSEATVDTPPFGTSSSSLKLNVFNIDGRYYFESNNIQPYALFGFAIASSKASATLLGVPTGEVSDSELGINIGGGLNYPLSDVLLLNGEMKYQTPGSGQLVINLGAAYVIRN